MSLPYYKRFPRDFLEATIGFSLELKGAYTIVLDLIYMRGGRLPDDPQYIAGQLGCSVRKWNSLRAELVSLGKLNVENGLISNFRADVLLEETRSFREKQAENRSHPNKNSGLQPPKADHLEPDTEEEVRETVAKATVVPAAPKPENVDYIRADRAFQLFVQAAHRQPCWSVPEAINKTRRASLIARVREVGLDGWERAIQRAEQSPFLTGRAGEKPFALALDWMLKPANFTKIVEGNYDDRTHLAGNGNASRSGNTSRNGDRLEAFDRLAERLQGGSFGSEAWGNDDPGAEGGHIIDITPTRITG
jgi:uncharacterized protein YdaU (DUF1376 family)